MRGYRRRLAQHLRQLRGDQSLAQFGRQIGVSSSSLQRIEMGEQDVKLSLLEQICVRLHCDIGDLFPPLQK